MSEHLMISAAQMHFNAKPLPLGSRSGKLEITGYLRILSGNCSKLGYVCRCECGRVCPKWANNFDTQLSCGCTKKPQKKRGRAHNYKAHIHTADGGRTGTHRSWASMIQRCTNSNLRGWVDYGGRGIKVCERWLGSYENFLADMGERPDGTSLDRIDVNGNYEPTNCRWATPQQQALNTRRTHLITYGGRTQNITAWANELGLDISTLVYRVQRHGGEEAIRRGGPAGLRDLPTVNRTGLRGVGKRGTKFFAQIQRAGKVVYLGRFDTAEAAHQAYLAARAEIQGSAP